MVSTDDVAARMAVSLSVNSSGLAAYPVKETIVPPISQESRCTMDKIFDRILDNLVLADLWKEHIPWAQLARAFARLSPL
jgi:hypothetical protein